MIIINNSIKIDETSVMRLNEKIKLTLNLRAPLPPPRVPVHAAVLRRHVPRRSFVVRSTGTTPHDRGTVCALRNDHRLPSRSKLSYA